MAISLNDDGTLKNPGFFVGSSTNGTDTYTATVTGLASQAGLLGKVLILKCDVANTGPATLNVNGYGAAPILRFQDAALQSDYIKPNKYHILTWDGTNYQMQSQPGVIPPPNYALDTGAANALVVARASHPLIEIPATLYPGYLIRVKVAAANTGASAIVIGSLPSVPIKRSDATNLLPGDFSVGLIVDLIYDGTNFQAPQLGLSKKYVALGDALSTYTGGAVEFAHGFGVTPDFFQVCAICISADAGYSIDHRIDASSIQVEEAGSPERASFSPYANATYVGVGVTDFVGGRFGVKQKATGAAIALDAAKWKLEFRAFIL
jgi:hypothetical protein